MNSQDLLARYAANKGISNATFDDTGHCYFESLQGRVPVSMETNEEGTRLHVCAYLGRLQDDESMYSVLGALMGLNGIFNALGRGTFAIEGDKADRIVLMQLYDTEHISPESFFEEMEVFLADAHEWYQRLQEPNLGLPDEDDDLPPQLEQSISLRA